jgi:hypothetical protein
VESGAPETPQWVWVRLAGGGVVRRLLVGGAREGYRLLTAPPDSADSPDMFGGDGQQRLPLDAGARRSGR